MKLLPKIRTKVSLAGRRNSAAVLVLFGTIGLLGGACYSVYHADVQNRIPLDSVSKNSPATEAPKTEAPASTVTDVALAPTGSAPNVEQHESAGPTTGNKYKLTSDGKMPTIQKRKLIVSPSVVTYDGTPASSTFTATTDDGAAVDMPSGNYDINFPYIVADMDTGDFSEHATWTMFIDAHNLIGKTKSFTATFSTMRPDAVGNEVDYYGSITVQMP